MWGSLVLNKTISWKIYQSSQGNISSGATLLIKLQLSSWSRFWFYFKNMPSGNTRNFTYYLRTISLQWKVSSFSGFKASINHEFWWEMERSFMVQLFKTKENKTKQNNLRFHCQKVSKFLWTNLQIAAI